MDGLYTISDCNKVISKCNKKIKEFNTIKQTITGLESKISTCESSVSNFSSYLEFLIINNKPIDQGSMEEIKGILKGISGDLKTITGECNTKIKSYRALKNRAITQRNALRYSLNNDDSTVVDTMS